MAILDNNTAAPATSKPGLMTKLDNTFKQHVTIGTIGLTALGYGAAKGGAYVGKKAINYFTKKKDDQSAQSNFSGGGIKFGRY